ncbi:aquaporin AQPAe.a isoform X1 [Toxorhynchites rutilus septentrionalis]|uniref:aquaporin AQPAe.a isoform X1 n=1 Tax=Toxorhynchites rutilus septentrionalis TaxID=329112 RepID=UPI00247A8301|nr:aquaporin AQPAe.a isoform X1 [Toxorhynchites rutilus septentrionalis]XP_055641054.1 aquaporin AQPAe.a isoform X1 [Toxorhynchites rutilus septentrionalis]XP_055641055.1 aquaporin AQPAe.a isoform X1 [Toxorhynchites rutilus septentrionalis]
MGTSYKIGMEELSAKSANIWKAMLAEFIGILILNFFGCAACTHAAGDKTLISLAFGLSVFMVVMSLGHISGGHINPAVTAGLLAAGKVSIVRAVLYVIAQCAGAVAGTAALKALLPEAYQNGLGQTGLKENVQDMQGLGIEFFLGFILVLCVFGVCDENKPDSRFVAPLAIGLTVTLGHLGAVEYTGSSMNPARSFGTALISENWNGHWIYWAGPILGGVCAALLYSQVFKAPRSEELSAPERYRVVADEKEVHDINLKLKYIDEDM